MLRMQCASRRRCPTCQGPRLWMTLQLEFSGTLSMPRRHLRPQGTKEEMSYMLLLLCDHAQLHISLSLHSSL